MSHTLSLQFMSTKIGTHKEIVKELNGSGFLCQERVQKVAMKMIGLFEKGEGAEKGA